ncbi:P-loop containing nucleoside triphosphate hydrolase protein [Desarmillaria tabescens]|uniref:P-loop containing nucleoside triphosphate hydrolase protein n=1 Tax=Armillaria tabescens TaxID=1929756 RepID=A0AA39J8K3_ARMTA|nr:P-loop containing nucleoside triphosphate hydrolase protein [Desarmillaria tabescens]KAK0437445.1 P-loop containing nucleoside triphosphate hydrolase protein [Desarmillaria tabescens]
MRRFWKDFAVVVTYAIVGHLSGSGSLDTSRLFTSYTVISIISTPLFSVRQNYGTVLAAYSSIKRLETYLLSTEASIERLNKKLGEKDEQLDQKAVVTMRNVHLGWKDRVVLSEVNISIESQMLNMVIRRIATGKLTLLASLLGEATILEGSISCSRGKGIAYCSQVPWLQTSHSIEQNITFSSTMDVLWYQAVIKACALDVDLALIPSGDSSLAKGLSGGQKAQIALAWAIYARTDLIILDDVLAALDATTSANIFSSLFGPNGLLHGRMVVMTMNHIPYLQHADWIITLGDGKVVEQGTFASLSMSQGGIGDLIHNGMVTALTSKITMVVGESSNATEILNESDKDDAAKEEIEAIQSGNATLRTYMHYARGAGYNCMLIYIVFLAVTVGIQIVTPVYLQLWAEANNGSTDSHLGQYLGGYAVIEVAYVAAFTAVFYYFIMILVPEASTQLHAGEVEAVMNAPMSFFDSTTTGRVISHFSQDIFVMDFEFPLAMHDAAYECTRLFGSAILMVAAVPYLVILLIFVAFSGYFIQKFYLATSKQLRRLDLTSKAPLYTLFQEAMELNGLLTIRAAHQQPLFTRQNSLRLAQSQRPFYFTNIA